MTTIPTQLEDSLGGRGGAGRERRPGRVRPDRPGPSRRHDPGLLRHLRRPRPRRRSGRSGLAHRLAQAVDAQGPRPAPAVARVGGGQRGAPAAAPPAPADRRGAVGRRSRAVRTRPTRPAGPTTWTSPTPSPGSTPTTAPCSPCATSRASTRPSSRGRPAGPPRARGPAWRACSTASERSSAMTDPFDFEPRLEARLIAHAARASRPFDAAAIAAAATGIARPAVVRPWTHLWPGSDGRVSPVRAAVVLLLLAIVLSAGTVLVGAVLRGQPPLPDRLVVVLPTVGPTQAAQHSAGTHPCADARHRSASLETPPVHGRRPRALRDPRPFDRCRDERHQ